MDGGGAIYEMTLTGSSWTVDQRPGPHACPSFWPPRPYVRSDSTDAILYRTCSSQVYEIYRTGPSSWYFGNLTAITGAPPAWSSPYPYVRSDGINSVVFQQYLDGGHIYEIYLQSGWRFADLSDAAGGL